MHVNPLPPSPHARSLHYAGLILLSCLIGLLFLQPVRFGDEFTYWSFAFDLHQHGLAAWQRHSFHDLRWPVWGILWVLQKVFNFGLASFYGEPLLYLSAGALLSFAFARLLTRSIAGAWTCAILYLFHPLLDTVCYRPMPDLSEGVWGGCVVLAWWLMMHSASRGRALLFAALTGAAVFIAESNRITGVFIVPVITLGTLLFFRRRFHWLVIAGVFAAAFYGAECAFYHGLFGDWLHDIHANLGNKGAKGTDPIALWYLPLRFVDELWKGNRLAPVYCLLTLAGIHAALGGRFSRADTRPEVEPSLLGKMIVFWFACLYLEYACAPQSIHGGWKPLIRDAERFLCGLLVPMSVLAGLGLMHVFRRVQVWRPLPGALKSPVTLGVLSVVLLAVVTSRSFFNLGFVPGMQRYLAAVQPGTKIFTHDSMRSLAFLVDPAAARSLEWSAPEKILDRDEKNEALSARCQEFWYIRKLVWLITRKKLEKKDGLEQVPLASYFEEPQRDWVMAKLLASGDTPDLVFSRRRLPTDPQPRIFPATAVEFAGLLPALPAEWVKNQGQPGPLRWNIPQTLRGQFVRIELEAASSQVEGVAMQLRFLSGNALQTEYLLKPYLHPESGMEFFAFEIPSNAEVCEVQLRFSKNAKSVQFTGFRAIVEAPPLLK